MSRHVRGQWPTFKSQQPKIQQYLIIVFTTEEK